MSDERQHCCGKFGKWTIIAVVLVLALGVLSWATMEQRKSIAQTVKEMDNCSTFVSCVEKAGLSGVLENDGPFTVFVPTNEAFGKVKADSLKNLLDNKSALTALILYHMIPKNVSTAELENLGDCLTCTVPQTAIACGQHHYGKGKCLKSEIPCSNGLVYLIDAVQFPPFMGNPDVIEEDEVTVVETVTEGDGSPNTVSKEIADKAKPSDAPAETKTNAGKAKSDEKTDSAPKGDTPQTVTAQKPVTDSPAEPQTSDVAAPVEKEMSPPTDATPATEATVENGTKGAPGESVPSGSDQSAPTPEEPAK